MGHRGPMTERRGYVPFPQALSAVTELMQSGKSYAPREVGELLDLNKIQVAAILLKLVQERILCRASGRYWINPQGELEV